MSIYYLPGTLLRTVHKNEQDKLAGWEDECDQGYRTGWGSVARSWECGPAIRDGQRINRSQQEGVEWGSVQANRGRDCGACEPFKTEHLSHLLYARHCNGGEAEADLQPDRETNH